MFKGLFEKQTHAHIKHSKSSEQQKELYRMLTMKPFCNLVSVYFEKRCSFTLVLRPQSLPVPHLFSSSDPFSLALKLGPLT